MVQDKAKSGTTQLRQQLQDTQNQRDQYLVHLQRIQANPAAAAQELAKVALSGDDCGDGDLVSAKNHRINELEEEVARLNKLAKATGSYMMRSSKMGGVVLAVDTAQAFICMIG